MLNLPETEEKKKYKLLELYETSPSDYMKDNLDVVSMEEYQTKICDSIYFNDRTAIRACHSVGKTWILARVALWFLNNFKNAIVITTAPTDRQVRKLLWGELREAYNNAKRPIGGRLLDVELKFSDKHYAIGFSPKKEAASSSTEQKGSSFQGFHSDYVLIIFDEATGISKDIWTMAEGLLTSGKIVKFVAIANPTTKNCEFYKCFSSPEWKKIKISCYDSPNMIANGFIDDRSLQEEIDYLRMLSEEERINRIQSYKKPVPYLLTAQFVVAYVYKLGFNHPLSLSKVFGEFPITEDNVFVQFEQVEESIAREVVAAPEDKHSVGVDVARYGEDETVITVLKGKKQTHKKNVVKRSIPEVTGEVINIINNLSEDGAGIVVCVDATGLGAGVYDLLEEKRREGVIPKRVQLVEVHNGASPEMDGENDEERKEAKARYANLKARQWDFLSEDIDELDLLDESIYSEELPTIKYSFDSKGRYVVESKKDYKARTGMASPDSSDSLALANFGRHVSIEYGSFKGHNKTEPIVKQKKRRDRKSRIKVREY